jgi:CHAT domain-containing protein/tetratricopeptide (TPR) repeat protein
MRDMNRPGACFAAIKHRFYLFAIMLVIFVPVSTAAQDSNVLKNSVLVLPLLPDQTIPPDKNRVGFAVKNLLENTLVLHDKLVENWFLWHLRNIFPKEEDLALWLKSQGPVPDAAKKIKLRYFLSGSISLQGEQLIARLNLTDNTNNSGLNRDILLDFPDLKQFRTEILDLLGKAGIGKPAQAQMTRMLWQEKLSHQAFASFGAGIYHDLVTTTYHNEKPQYDPQSLESGLRDSPASYLLLNSLGWVVYRQKKYAEAKAIFERALAANPDGLDSADGMIQCETLTENEVQAERWVIRKAEIQGQEVKIAQARFWNRRGNVAYEKQDYDKSIIYYNKAIALNPSIITYLTNLADAYRNKREFAEARRLLESALQKVTNPEDRKDVETTLAKVHHFWGRFHRSNGSDDKALEQFQAAYEIHKNLNPRDSAPDLMFIGLSYNRKGEAEKGLHYIERARAIYAESKDLAQEAEMLLLMAFAYGDLNQRDKQIAAQEAALAKAIQVQDEAIQVKALNNLGNAYISSDKAEKSFEYLERALAMARKREKENEIAAILRNLGYAYKNLNQIEKAIDFYQQSKLIYKKLNNKFEVRLTLRLMGFAFRSDSKYAEAAKVWEEALPLAVDLKNKDDVATDAMDLGETYGLLKRFDEGRKYIELAISVAVEAKNKGLERDALYKMGVLLWTLREYKSKENTESVYLETIQFYERSLAISQSLGDKDSERDIYSRLVWPHLDLKQYAKAEFCAAKSLSLARELKNRKGEALALTALGAIHMKFSSKMDIALLRNAGDRNFTKAIEYYEQALPIMREIKDRYGERSILEYIGAAYFFSSQYAKGIKIFEQTLMIARELKDRSRESTSLNNLMYAWRQLDNPQLAIFYGKQSVNAKQEVRGELVGINREFQAGFLEQNERTYRYLADLLINQGRLPEAQQVLGLLKEEEYFDFVRRDNKDAASLKGRSEYTRKEADWEKRFSEITGKLTALGVEYNGLLAKPALLPEEERRRDQLQRDLVVANQAFQGFLQQLATDLGKPETEKVIPEVSKSLRRTLRDLGANAVALYTLVTDEKYVVIVVTPRVEVAREYKIAAADLNRLVLDFREAIQNPNLDPRPLAKKLYDVLIAPIANDLQGANAETLMWSLDGVLRYVPMAALYDGEKYLVERYKNVVITLASMDSLKDQPRTNWTGLGLGVSKPHSGFAPLSAVPDELKEIIKESTSVSAGKGVLPGQVMLDEAFTKETMEAGLRRRPAMVHIASHFRFQPGNEADSYLLLGNGRHLSLAEINSAVDLFDGVELLTLSACDTAMSGAGANGKEVESFGVLAQRQGAKAVMASLWPVADRSTKEFMKTFYQQREAKPGTLKAEALRQAQLALLFGKVNATSSEQSKRGPTIEVSGQTKPIPFKKDAALPYAHPYFWAPFILIGNWR